MNKLTEIQSRQLYYNLKYPFISYSSCQILKQNHLEFKSEEL
jgi:hypothetical protein